MEARPPVNSQVTLVGGPKSGKTALVRRLVGLEFEPQYQPTLTTQWANKRIQANGGFCDISIEDTPGQPCLILPPPHSNLMVVYDSTNPDSFSLAEQFLVQLRSAKHHKVLVAAKCDESEGVEITQGMKVARDMGVEYVETSARTGRNVEEALRVTVRRGDESPSSHLTSHLGDLSMNDVKELISFNADIDHLSISSSGSYSPPLTLSPNSPDSFEDGETPESMALVEEVREGPVILTQVPIYVQTSEAGTQTERRPTKKKEELDKFWLRQFRKYMKGHYEKLKVSMSMGEKTWWKKYLSPDMKPEKNRRFKSYSRAYKEELFRDPAFLPGFRRWFEQEGEKLLGRIFGRGSPGYVTYYDHALTQFLEIGSKPSDFDPEYFLTVS